MTGTRKTMASFFLLFSFSIIAIFRCPPVNGFTVRDMRPTLFFDYSMVEEHSELLILADMPIQKYKAFRLENPARLVIDIPGFSLLEDVVGLPVNRPELTRIRIAKHPDKIRFVFDLTQKKGVNHEILKLETGLKVIIKIDRRQVINAKKTKISKKGPIKAIPPAGKILPPASFSTVFGDQRVTILFHKAPIQEFFAYVADKSGMEIEVNKDISTTISQRLTDVPLSRTIEQILTLYKLQLLMDGRHIQVVPAKSGKKTATNAP